VLNEGDGFFEKNKYIYKGVNQTENFTEVKTKNNTFYIDEKHH